MQTWYERVSGVDRDGRRFSYRLEDVQCRLVDDRVVVVGREVGDCGEDLGERVIDIENLQQRRPLELAA
jgi:hypothetical protein